MSPPSRGALSQGAVRAMGSRFAKPVARIALIAMGLVALAFIGRTGIAGTFGSSASAPIVSVDAAAVAAKAVADPIVAATPVAPPPPSPPPMVHGSASADDPVILNAADANDLKRLPGIGEKRANAILALRTHLGRFRAVEDLLKVKGVGRATLKRLRPLIRLDTATTDAG